MKNGFPIGILGGVKLNINEKIYHITPGIHKVLTNTSSTPLKILNDKDRDIFIKILESFHFEKYEAIRGEIQSGRYKQSKFNFKKYNLKVQGNEKIIKPSNIIDIYTRLEILLALKLFGHTDTLTEASNLTDEMYKRGDIQTYKTKCS